MLPQVIRPGICYYCRTRAGTEHYRGMWSCKRCLLQRDLQDAFLVILMVVCMATIVGMAARRSGYCPRCPDVPMQVLRVIHAWTH